MRRLLKPIYLILTTQAAVSLIFVFNRFVALDEGFYLAAAQRVADGMLPYQDFCFSTDAVTATDVLRSIGVGHQFVTAAQGNSGACRGADDTHDVSYCKRSAKNVSLANIAAFFVAFSGISFNWHTVFKPYAFVDLFLLASFGLLLQARIEKERLGWTIFATLLALGVAINFRSLLAVLLPVYGYFLFKAIKHHNASLGQRLGAAVGGLLLPTLPALYLLATGFEQFWFNNLVFHLHREPIDAFSELIKHKALTVGKFLVLPQTLLLLGMAAAATYFIRNRLVGSANFYKPAFVVGTTLFLIYLVPTPLHLQYFQQTIPFLVILAFPTAEFFRRYDTGGLISASAALIYLVGIAPFIYLFMLTPRERDERLQWDHINSVVVENSIGDIAIRYSPLGVGGVQRAFRPQAAARQRTRGFLLSPGSRERCLCAKSSSHK